MFLLIVSAIVLADLHITVQVLIDPAYMCTIIIILKALHRNFLVESYIHKERALFPCLL